MALAPRTVGTTSVTDRVTVPNRTITTTTTVTTVSAPELSGVRLLDNMRGLSIDFVGYNLRPIREVGFYFDDMPMSQFIQRPNILHLDSDNSFFGFGDGKEFVSVGGTNVEILWAETDVTSSNTKVYVKEFESISFPVSVGNTVTGLTSGGVGNVVSYIHSSGVAQSGSNTEAILLALDANADTDDYYTGNVISIQSGETSNITSYNAATRTADVSPSFTAVTTNIIYSIGDSRSLYSANTTPRSWTSERGMVCGVFHFPDPSANSNYTTTVGDRMFKILDNFQNDENDFTTKAEYRFTSQGLAVDQTQLIERSTRTRVQDISPPPPPPPTRPQFIGRSGHDPVAQHFFVPANEYPEGMFLSSVDLFFKNKGSILPVEVQIRPMINGVPDSNLVLPGATTIKQANDIKVSDNPDSSNSSTYTRFTFPSPVYLEGDGDYAFVVLTNSYEYDMYVAEQGQTILGSDRIVTRQPYAYSMFKGQNSKTYTPIQSETAMFRLNKAVFENTGSLSFNESKNTNWVGSGNTFYDMFEVHSDAAELVGTNMDFEYKATTNANTTIETSYTEFQPDDMVEPTESKVLFNPGVGTTSFEMKVALSTDNTDISPIMWRKRQNLITTRYNINNMGLTAENLAIAAVGTGYANATSNVVFTSPTGSGANGNLEFNGSGELTKITMDNEGLGYWDNVSATIDGAGSGASIVVNTETGSKGGNGLVRHLSSVVTLKEGFDAGDLRTILTCKKPPTSNVNVYYRVKNSLDGDTVRDKNWTKMAQKTSIAEVTKLNSTELIELEFRPSLTSNNITYTSDVTSTTYSTFNQYQIKIVHSASTPTAAKVPVSYDVRTLALPADTY